MNRHRHKKGLHCSSIERVAGIALIILGIIGMLTPIVPGSPLFIAGCLILGVDIKQHIRKFRKM